MYQSNIFQEVKASMSMREAAEMYGYPPNRSGFICCPFHGEKTASLKLYNDSFHCYGCGKHGDVIGFVADLKGISQMEAAKELAASCGIRTEEQSRNMQKPKATKAQLRQFYQAWENRAFVILRSYRFMLLDFREHFKPKPEDETLYPLFAQALQELPEVEEDLRIFTQGKQEERQAFYLSRKDVIERYDREYRKYYG